jgi:hypothetical protein
MAFRGVDVRQSGDRVVFRASLKDTSNAKITSGTASLYVYEIQSDGSFKSYDFNSNTFKTTALTTETVSMTHRQGNNSTTNTGVWTYALTTVTGFTRGNVYIAVVSHSSAVPPQQEREFQYGEAQGDQTINAAGQVQVQSGTATGQIKLTLGIPDANLVQVDGGTTTDGSASLKLQHFWVQATDGFDACRMTAVGGGYGQKISSDATEGLYVLSTADDHHGAKFQGGAAASTTTYGAYYAGSGSTGIFGGMAGNVVGNVTGSIGSLATQAKTDVENAVWNATHASHTNAGSFGGYVDSAISGVSTGGLSAGSIAFAVWNELKASHTTAGTYGVLVDSQLSLIAANVNQTLAYAGNVNTTASHLDTMLVLNGSVYRYTAAALALAPAGGGGGGTAPTADENAAAVVAALAGSVPVNIISPFDPQHLDLFRGDQYLSSDGPGRTFSITYQTGEPWPDTISSAKFTCKPTDETLDDHPGAASISDLACVVDVATGAGRKVTVNLTASNVATLQASLTGTNGYRWWIIANGSNSATLRSGTMTVRPDPTAT